jgi:hypothetical protein
MLTESRGLRTRLLVFHKKPATDMTQKLGLLSWATPHILSGIAGAFIAMITTIHEE